MTTEPKTKSFDVRLVVDIDSVSDCDSFDQYDITDDLAALIMSDYPIADYTILDEIPDDQILAAAKRIEQKRKIESRLESFKLRETVTIRWDNPGAPNGESYTGIEVPAVDLVEIVTRHYESQIEKLES